MPIGPTELIIIFLIIFFVFGAGKLPEVGGALGKGIREFRAATRDEAATEGSQPAKNESSN